MTPAGHRVYTLSQLAVLKPDLLSDERENRTAYYLRSSDGNQVLLDAQLSLLKAKYGDSPDYIIRDKASGLNDNRKGLQRLLRLAEEGKLTRVCVTEKDRLTRFGYSFLQELFRKNNVEVIVLGNTKTKSPHEELIQDFLSLLASFSGKYYRLRGHQQKKDFLGKITKEVE
jgi:putative resolvase